MEGLDSIDDDTLDVVQRLVAEVSCTMCGDIYDNPHTCSPGCGHTFCFECIFHHIQGPGIVKSQCPICFLPVWNRDMSHNHTLASVSDSLKALLKLVRNPPGCTADKPPTPTPQDTPKSSTYLPAPAPSFHTFLQQLLTDAQASGKVPQKLLALPSLTPITQAGFDTLHAELSVIHEHLAQIDDLLELDITPGIGGVRGQDKFGAKCRGVKGLQGMLDVQGMHGANDVLHVEDVEDVLNVQDVQSGEDVEDVEDVLNVQDVQSVEDVEEVEDVQGVGDVEEEQSVDDVEDVECARDLQGVEDAQCVEDVENAQDVEDAEDAHDMEDVEDVEDVEGQAQAMSAATAAAPPEPQHPCSKRQGVRRSVAGPVATSVDAGSTQNADGTDKEALDMEHIDRDMAALGYRVDSDNLLYGTESLLASLNVSPVTPLFSQPAGNAAVMGGKAKGPEGAACVVMSAAGCKARGSNAAGLSSAATAACAGGVDAAAAAAAARTAGVGTAACDAPKSMSPHHAAPKPRSPPNAAPKPISPPIATPRPTSVLNTVSIAPHQTNERTHHQSTRHTVWNHSGRASQPSQAGITAFLTPTATSLQTSNSPDSNNRTGGPNSHMQLFGQDNLLAENNNRVSGQDSYLCADSNTVPSKDNARPRQNNTVAGESVDLSGGEDTLCGKDITLSGKDSTVFGKINSISGKENTVPGMGQSGFLVGKAAVGKRKTGSGGQGAIGKSRKKTSGKGSGSSVLDMLKKGDAKERQHGSKDEPPATPPGSVGKWLIGRQVNVWKSNARCRTGLVVDYKPSKGVHLVKWVGDRGPAVEVDMDKQVWCLVEGENSQDPDHHPSAMAAGSNPKRQKLDKTDTGRAASSRVTTNDVVSGCSQDCVPLRQLLSQPHQEDGSVSLLQQQNNASNPFLQRVASGPQLPQQQKQQQQQQQQKPHQKPHQPPHQQAHQQAHQQPHQQAHQQAHQQPHQQAHQQPHQQPQQQQEREQNLGALLEQQTGRSYVFLQRHENGTVTQEARNAMQPREDNVCDVHDLSTFCDEVNNAMQEALHAVDKGVVEHAQGCEGRAGEGEITGHGCDKGIAGKDTVRGNEGGREGEGRRGKEGGREGERRIGKEGGREGERRIGKDEGEEVGRRMGKGHTVNTVEGKEGQQRIKKARGWEGVQMMEGVKGKERERGNKGVHGQSKDRDHQGGKAKEGRQRMTSTHEQEREKVYGKEKGGERNEGRGGDCGSGQEGAKEVGSGRVVQQGKQREKGERIDCEQGKSCEHEEGTNQAGKGGARKQGKGGSHEQGQEREQSKLCELGKQCEEGQEREHRKGAGEQGKAGHGQNSREKGGTCGQGQESEKHKGGTCEQKGGSLKQGGIEEGRNGQRADGRGRNNQDGQGKNGQQERNRTEGRQDNRQAQDKEVEKREPTNGEATNADVKTADGTNADIKNQEVKDQQGNESTRGKETEAMARKAKLQPSAPVAGGLPNTAVRKKNIKPEILAEVGKKKVDYVIASSSKGALKELGLPLRQLCEKQKNGMLTKAVTKHCTHVIVQADEAGIVRERTQRYLEGLLLGCWIVTPAWAEKCIETQSWQPEEEYEVKGDTFSEGSARASRLRAKEKGTRLFHDVRLCLHLWAEGKEQVTCCVRSFIELGGGKMVTKEQLDREVKSKGSSEAVSVANPKYLFMWPSKRDVPEPLIAESKKCGCPVVLFNWLNDSISTCRQLALDAYVLP